MKRLWLCVGILLCGITVAAAEADNPAEVEEQEEELEILERNIRLDFKAVPLDPGDKGIYIVTASPDYETSVRHEGNDARIFFEVSGEVKLLDDGRIFVSYEANTIINSNDQETEFGFRSSVILKPGQELGVSRMGDKTFMIRASYVDATGAPE